VNRFADTGSPETSPPPANPRSDCRFRTRCWKAQDKCAGEEPLLAIPERFASATP
jgi:oligopeptide transport system ATP-binding protein